jgi:hypothetical protein
MKLAEMLLPEFDSEMANTRKTLERIPEEKLAWKPHQKSMALAELAGHLAELAALTAAIIKQNTYDVPVPSIYGPSVDEGQSG